MPVRKRLRTDLTAAMSDGDTQLVTLIRILLAAIDNAVGAGYWVAEPPRVNFQFSYPDNRSDRGSDWKLGFRNLTSGVVRIPIYLRCLDITP